MQVWYQLCQSRCGFDCWQFRRTVNYNYSLLPPHRCEFYSAALEEFDDNIKIHKKLDILTTEGKTMLIFILWDGFQVCEICELEGLLFG